MKTIMFFGDSNTWGYDCTTTRRYPSDIRFTGLLDTRLEDCRIIEEGLKGRTNAVDDCLAPGRNGLEVLPMLLCTHDPIDIFVIMLGTNDVKRRFNKSAIEIAMGLELNIQIVQTPQFWGGVEAPKILVVCPPGVTVDYTGNIMGGYFDEGSVERSKQLHLQYCRVARTYRCEYLNAMDFTGPCKEDGVHLDPQGHWELAAALEKKLRMMLNNLEE